MFKNSFNNIYTNYLYKFIAFESFINVLLHFKTFIKVTIKLDLVIFKVIKYILRFIAFNNIKNRFILDLFITSI